MHREKGLSIIELMVVIAIIGIIAGIGVPSFRQMMLDNRLVTTTNQILTALQQARSEAASRRSAVTLCGADDITADTPECASDTDWSAGILLMQNRAGTQTVIKMLPAASAQEITVTSDATQVVYAVDGSTAARTITITDSRSADDPEVCRQIAINGVGQARSLTGDERVCDQ